MISTRFAVMASSGIFFFLFLDGGTWWVLQDLRSDLGEAGKDSVCWSVQSANRPWKKASVPQVWLGSKADVLIGNIVLLHQGLCIILILIIIIFFMLLFNECLHLLNGGHSMTSHVTCHIPPPGTFHSLNLK